MPEAASEGGDDAASGVKTCGTLSILYGPDANGPLRRRARAYAHGLGRAPRLALARGAAPPARELPPQREVEDENDEQKHGRAPPRPPARINPQRPRAQRGDDERHEQLGRAQECDRRLSPETEVVRPSGRHRHPGEHHRARAGNDAGQARELAPAKALKRRQSPPGQHRECEIHFQQVTRGHAEEVEDGDVVDQLIKPEGEEPARREREADCGRGGPEERARIPLDARARPASQRSRHACDV